jgi:CBS-domain-containing membrane protein
MKIDMDRKCVKDLMVPLDEYALIYQEDTLLDAILGLDEAQKRLPPGRQPYRAVLIVDDNNEIIGKIGQLCFMNALEPKYNVVSDLGTLSRAGVSSIFISSMMEHVRFFQDSLYALCRRALSTKVKDVMHPITESIDENMSLHEAIYRIVSFQTLSILVTRENKVVGLLRLSDLFEEITEQMKRLTT